MSQKLYVLADVYGWSTPIEGAPLRRDYHLARRGDLIEVDQAEADRGLALAAAGNGGLSRDAGALQAATSASLEPPSWPDEQLDSANVEDTVAYLGQHPSEASRVLAREQSRDTRDLKVRKTVVEAAERVEQAYQDQIDADAAARAEFDAAEQRAFAAASGAASTAPRIP